MSITRVQQLSASAYNQGYLYASNQWVTVLTNNPQAGNTLLMYIVSKSLLQINSIVQGGSLAQWNLVTSYTSAPNKNIYVYSLNPIPKLSNSTITINLLVGQYNFVTFIEEINGFTYPYLLDVVGVNSGTATNTYFSGISTTKYNNEYLVNLYCYYSPNWTGDSAGSNPTNGYSTSGITTSNISQKIGGWIGNYTGSSPVANDYFGLIINTGISSASGTTIGGYITDANARNNDYAAITLGFAVNQFVNNPVALPTNPLTDGRCLASVFATLSDVNAVQYWYNQGIRNIFMPDYNTSWYLFETTKGQYINPASLTTAVTNLLSVGIRPMLANYGMNPLYLDYDSTAVYPQFTFANFGSSGYAGSVGVTTFIYYAAKNNISSSVATVGASDSNWQLVTPYWNISSTYGIGTFVVYQTAFGTSYYCMSIANNNIGNTPNTSTNSFWYYCGAYQPINGKSINQGAGATSPYNIFFPNTSYANDSISTGVSTIFLPLNSGYTKSSSNIYNTANTQLPVTSIMQNGWANYINYIVGLYSGNGVLYRFWNEPYYFTTPAPPPLQGLGQSYAQATVAKYILQSNIAIKNKLNQTSALANEYILFPDQDTNGIYYGSYTLTGNTNTAQGNIGTSVLYYSALFDYHNYPAGFDPEATTYFLGSNGDSLVANVQIPIKGSNSEWGIDANWYYNYIYNYPASPYQYVSELDSGSNLNLVGYTTSIGSRWNLGSGSWNGTWSTNTPTSVTDPIGGNAAWQISDPDFIGSTSNTGYNIGEIGVFYTGQNTQIVAGNSYCISVWLRTNPYPGQYPYLPVRLAVGNYGFRDFVIDPVWRRYSVAYTIPNGVTLSNANRVFGVERSFPVGLTSYRWQMAFPQTELLSSINYLNYNTVGVTTLLLDVQKQAMLRHWIAGKNNNDALMSPYVYVDTGGQKYGLAEGTIGIGATNNSKRPSFGAYKILPSYNANIIRYTRHHGSTGGSYNSNPSYYGYNVNNTVYTTFLSTIPTVGNALVCYIASKNYLNINNILLNGSNQYFNQITSVSANNIYLYVYYLPYVSAGISSVITLNLNSGSNLFTSFIEEVSGISNVNSFVYSNGINTSIYNTGSIPLSSISTGYLVNIFVYNNPSVSNNDPYIWNASNNYLIPQVLNFSPNPISQGANGWIGNGSTSVININDTFGMTFTYRPYIADPNSNINSLGGSVVDFNGNLNNYLSLAIAFNQGSAAPVLYASSNNISNNRPLPTSPLIDGKGASGFTTAIGGGFNSTVTAYTAYFNDGFQIYKMYDILHALDVNWWETEKVKGQLIGFNASGINTGLSNLDDQINSITGISQSCRVMYTYHGQNNPLYFDYDYSCNYPSFVFCNFPATGFGTGITNFVYYSLNNNNIGTSPGINTSNQWWQLVTPYWTSTTTYIGLSSFVVYQSPLGTSQYYLALQNSTNVVPTGATDSYWYYCNVPSGYQDKSTTAINYTPYALTVNLQGLSTYFTSLSSSSPYTGTQITVGYNSTGSSSFNIIGWQQDFITSIQQQGFANFATQVMQRYAGKGILWEIEAMPNVNYGNKAVLEGNTYSQNMDIAIMQNAKYYYNNFVNLVNTKRGISSIANEYIVGPSLLMAPNSNSNTVGLAVTYAYYLLTNYFGAGLSYYADAISSYNWFDGLGVNPEYASKFQNQVLNSYMKSAGKVVPLISSEWGVGKSSFASTTSGYGYLGRYNNQLSWSDTLIYPTANSNYGLFTTSPSVYVDNPTSAITGINLVGYSSTFGLNFSASQYGSSKLWYNYANKTLSTQSFIRLGVGTTGDPNFNNYAWQFDLVNNYSAVISFGDQLAYQSGILWGANTNTTISYGVSTGFIASVYLRGVFQPGQIQLIPVSLGVSAAVYAEQVFFVDSNWRRYSVFVNLPSNISTSQTNRTFTIYKPFETPIGYSSTIQMAFPQLEYAAWPLGYASSIQTMMYSWGQANIITRKLIQDAKDGAIASIYASLHESKYAATATFGGALANYSNTFASFPLPTLKFPAYYAFNNGLTSGVPAYNANIYKEIRQFGSTGGSKWASTNNSGFNANTTYTAYLNSNPIPGNSLVMYIASKWPLNINSITQGGSQQSWSTLQNGSANNGNLYIYTWALTNVYSGATNIVSMNLGVGSNLFCTQIDEISNISYINPIGMSTYGYGLSTSVYTIAPVNSSVQNSLWVNVFAYYNSSPNKDPHPAYATNGYLTSDIFFNPPNPIIQGTTGWYGINTGTIVISDTFGMTISYRPVNFIGQIGGSITDITGTLNNYLGLALSLNILGSTPNPGNSAMPGYRKYYNGRYGV